MERGDQRVILVTRRTRLEELVRRHNTVEQARFQTEHLGMDFEDFVAEDRAFHAALQVTLATLERHARVQRLDRDFLPNFLFPPDALVVALGQDGLVANTLKYLQGQPLMGVNPDAGRWDGVLLPFAPADLERAVPDALAQRLSRREVTMARARLSDGQTLLAVNDFFVGMRGHASARYELTWRGRTERQSSSGVIISTGLGSTGWLRSVLTGAQGVTGTALAKDRKAIRENGLPWDAKRLVFSVREPFPSRWTETGLVFGAVEPGHPLRVRSLMPEGGVLFSDGIEQDALEFRSGFEAVVDFADHSGVLLH